jgi:hypothetical protein
VAIRNVKTDLCSYKEFLTDMKKARFQPTPESSFKKMDDSQPSASAL